MVIHSLLSLPPPPSPPPSPPPPSPYLSVFSIQLPLLKNHHDSPSHLYLNVDMERDQRGQKNATKEQQAKRYQPATHKVPNTSRVCVRDSHIESENGRVPLACYRRANAKCDSRRMAHTDCEVMEENYNATISNNREADLTAHN